MRSDRRGGDNGASPKTTRPFDIQGSLPRGVTSLEASAGTGKTFAIAGLAARFLAEGTPVEELLLVTFTRIATGELRARVRERLVGVERGLAGVLEGVAPDPDDEVLARLAGSSRDELATGRDALRRAIAAFDAITITTTHGFCQHVLSGLGVLGDVDRDVVFVEDVADLVEQVVDDLYVRRFRGAFGEGPPPLSRAQALAIGRRAVDNADAVLQPANAPADSVATMRYRLAGAVRAELEARKRSAGILTYDDFLTRLQGTLAGETHGEAACARLRERYRVVLIDEFQDTDPIQWDIVRRAFGDGDTTLVLIGDPKQAIYAFRGADVYAYLQASLHAAVRETLDVNWRSDQPLVDAYDALFAGARLGHPEIVYRHVRAAAPHRAAGLTGAPVTAPLRIRVVHRADGLVTLTPNEYAEVNTTRAHVAADLADDLVGLLDSGAELESRSPGRGRERVRPAHVAVLVRTNRQARTVLTALQHAGIPAVFSGVGSVCATDAARHWLWLLEALERPASPPLTHRAALTPFLGWDAERVATADDRAWEEVHARLHDWAGVLRRRGVAALFETVGATQGVAARVLRGGGGERTLADLRHLAEILHATAANEQIGVAALAAWLRQRITDAELDVENEERSRRLESDAEAVQVLTIHRSKGLEFPVVYCPYLWDQGFVPEDLPLFHDADAGDRRTVDVGGAESPDAVRHRNQYVAEERGEDLRLAYVALTRARHQAVVWWAGSRDSRNSPLTRLAFLKQPDGTIPAEVTGTPPDDALVGRLEELAAQAPGLISVERTVPAGRSHWTPPTQPRVELDLARFDRDLDERWRRTSYSDLTARAHDPLVASEPDEAVITDEEPGAPAAPQPAPAEPPPAQAAGQGVELPLAAMPGGLEIGTFIHRVLERTDFAVANLDAELAARISEAGASRPLDIGAPETVVAGLRAAIETPLGPLVDDLRLRDLERAHRLDELTFELPLAGGDTPWAAVRVAAIGQLLRSHLPAGDPLAGYAERLDDPVLDGAVRGYLSGSLDLVLRVGRAGGPERFAVVDYKTNRLEPAGGPASAWHYRPAALAEEMQRMHYPLQALLYTAALHRYLRWRLPRYDPERNLAGVLYLFLRGMCGPDTPRLNGQPYGVFAWRPPSAVITGLSDLLDRGGGA